MDGRAEHLPDGSRLRCGDATHEAVPVPRQLWNVQCTARRSTDGLPCDAWSMRGSFTCRVHGSSTQAARLWAEYRLWHAQIDRRLIRAFAAFDARMRARLEERERAYGAGLDRRPPGP
jgi:hypothetical protein